jgi:hypothetical protein
LASLCRSSGHQDALNNRLKFVFCDRIERAVPQMIRPPMVKSSLAVENLGRGFDLGIASADPSISLARLFRRLPASRTSWLIRVMAHPENRDGNPGCRQNKHTLTVPVNVALPADMLVQIDRFAESHGYTRSGFLT